MHGIFATASTPTSGTACSTSALDNCVEPMANFASGLAGGTASGASDPVLFGGSGGGNANSLWNVVHNNGSKHRE